MLPPMGSRARLLGFIVTSYGVFACGGDDARPKNSGGGAGEAGAPGAGGGESPAGGTDAGGQPTEGQGGEVPSTGGTGTGEGGTAPQGAAGEGGAETEATSVTFTIVSAEDVHAISPLIYGANVEELDCSDPKARFTLCRRGSAPWSSYNWENNASNAGSARCSENNDALSASTAPGGAVTATITEAEAAGAATLVTLPMLDHVAADKTAGSAPPDCSGDVTKSVNYLSTRFKQNRARKGAALSGTPDLGDGFVNQDEFVALLSDNYTDAHLLFALDNQPELWKFTHPAIRPVAPTYAEATNLSIEYAKMVKDNFAGAEVVGFVGYGFLAAHNFQESPDFDSKGPYLPYYLAELKAASQTDARRLIDYVDIHWYPELYADGSVRIIGESVTAEAVAKRVAAPRSLWDPSFVEDSWLTATFKGGEPIELLTWLGDQVADHYPGTKVSISEWNYGGVGHISGAVAAADALGIFGREGLGFAAVSSSIPDAPFLIGAFQLFRNYDGTGSAFGDTSIFAASSDIEAASVYASLDAGNDSRMVLVAINRSATALDATVNIDHAVSFAKLTAYRISEGQPVPALVGTFPPDSTNSFNYPMPGYSVSVLVAEE